MNFYPSEPKERLTLSQAIVKYWQAQYSEYDGVEQRFIQGIWGSLDMGMFPG